MDRRSRPRFELVGQLAGSLEVVLRCPVRNIGFQGALLECPVPLGPRSIHRLTLEIDGRQTTVDVRVCHSRPGTGPGDAPVHLVGVAFLTAVPWLGGLIAERLRVNEDSGDAHGV